MSCFKKVLLLLSIVGGINWGIYGIWGFNAVGWLLGGSMSWLSRTVFIIVGLSSLCLIPGLFMAETKTADKGTGGEGFCQWRGSLPHPLRREPPPRGGQESKSENLTVPAFSYNLLHFQLAAAGVHADAEHNADAEIHHDDA